LPSVARNRLVFDTTKNVIVTALIHSTDLMMLASVKLRREQKLSVARAVQILARRAEKPGMAASPARNAIVTMINLLVLKRTPEKVRPR
jgi:hypothetical protein